MKRKFWNTIMDTVIDLLELYMSRFGKDVAILCIEDEHVTVMIAEVDVVDNVPVPRGTRIMLTIPHMRLNCQELLHELRRMGIVEDVNVVETESFWNMSMIIR